MCLREGIHLAAQDNVAAQESDRRKIQVGGGIGVFDVAHFDNLAVKIAVAGRAFGPDADLRQIKVTLQRPEIRRHRKGGRNRHRLREFHNVQRVQCIDHWRCVGIQRKKYPELLVQVGQGAAEFVLGGLSNRLHLFLGDFVHAPPMRLWQRIEQRLNRRDFLLDRIGELAIHCVKVQAIPEFNDQLARLKVVIHCRSPLNDGRPWQKCKRGWRVRERNKSAAQQRQTVLQFFITL